MGLKNTLFSTNATPPEDPTPDPPRSDQRGIGETYEHWGKRWAAAVTGSPIALQPALLSVLSLLRTEQTNDLNQQQINKVKINAEIQVAQNNIDNLLNEQSRTQSSIDNIDQQINGLNQRIEELHASRPESKLAATYFWIGGFIILLLTLYLILFYISTGYSAFFGTGVKTVGKALFNPRAFNLAWAESWYAGLFVTLLPIVFIALGILLHRFIIKEGIEKYFKVTALYVVTFIFDGLLAFQIAAKVFKPTPGHPKLLVSEAFQDPNFWIVIFAGFIAYVIWGLLFDTTMDSYRDMVSNDRLIKNLQNQEKQHQAKKQELNDTLSLKDNDITRLRNEIATKQVQLQSTVIIDLDLIKRELSNFFMGWLSFMVLIGLEVNQQQTAQGHFDNVISNLN